MTTETGKCEGIALSILCSDVLLRLISFSLPYFDKSIYKSLKHNI